MRTVAMAGTRHLDGATARLPADPRALVDQPAANPGDENTPTGLPAHAFKSFRDRVDIRWMTELRGQPRERFGVGRLRLSYRRVAHSEIVFRPLARFPWCARARNRL